MTDNFYRKWRPRSFAELFGQEHVARTLLNALAGGRVAHAYLFAGPRGTGKTTSGRLFAKALNCTDRQAGEPCNKCESCLTFLAGRAMDLIELDAASNRGIDEIRGLRDKVAFAPGAGDYKVYLIDEVHMLTDAAFNALLKTLEEPPPHAVFILATTEAHRVPATVLSRCQRFDFRRAPLSALIANLQRICEGEDIRCEPAALELISRSATGSHRDAVNVLDQLATSYGADLTVEHVRAGLGLIGDERSGRLARLALAGDLGGGLSLIASVRDDGLDLRQFQRELVAELRALLMAKSGLAPEDGATEERLRELQAAVADVTTPRLLAALRAFGEADLKPDPNSTLPLDIALAACALADGAMGQSGNRAAAVAPVASNGAEMASRREPAASTPRPQPPVERPVSAAPPRVEAARPIEARQPDAAPSASEQPVAAPPPVAAANGASTPDLAAARTQMRRLYEEARGRSVPLGALINSGCDIIEADESNVVIGFKFAFHAEKAQQSAAVIADVVSGLLGRAVSVRCQHEPNVEDWKAREPSTRSPLVRAAQEMGARVLPSQPEV